VSVLALSGAAFIVSERIILRRFMAHNLLIQAEIVADNCKAALVFKEAKDAEEILKALQAESSIVSACIYTNSGEPFAGYYRDGADKSPYPSGLKEDGHFFNDGLLLAFKTVVLDGEIIGTVCLRSNLGPMREMFKLHTCITIAVILFASLVALLLSSMLQGVISKPILSLTDTARVVSEKGDYSTRALKQANDEIGLLIDAFNKMLEQIQKRDMELVERAGELSAANGQLTREIAERKRIEESQKRLVAIIETASDFIGFADAKDKHIIYVNKAGRKMCGIGNDDDVTKLKICDVHPEWTNKLLADEIIPVAVRDGMWTGECAFLNIKDKHEIPVLMVLSSHKASNGEVEVFSTISRNITERKKAEDTLKETTNLLQNIINSSADLIFVKDRDLRMLLCNEAHARAVGKRPSDMYGKTDIENGWLPELVKGDPAKGIKGFENDDRDALSGKVVRNTNDPANVGAEIRTFDTIKLPLRNPQGSIIGVLGIARDITERKQAEAELRATHERLLEASRMAGMAEVAADVLHNVGNVLNSINVSTTLITGKVTNSEVANLEKVARIINEHIDEIGTFFTEHPQGKHIPVYLTEVSKCLQAEQTDIISKLQVLTDNVQHIKDIISMQQAYAKVSGVEVQISPTRLVEDAIRINSAGLQRHGTRLVREFEELPDMEIDKQRVLQILVNLISNAKYALSDSKKREKLVTVRIYRHGEDHFRIEVADNGVGIPEENLTKIFSHGFTTKEGGHGFGLHGSALAASQVGGSLRVHSDGVEQGATFTLELPFKPTKVVS
jgi:PAS domain S-box-containing protein